METIKKNLALFAGGAILAALLIANSVGVFAAEVPAQPAPTECADCQTIQDDLDAAYAELALLEDDAANYSTTAETLLDQATTNLYGGDPLLTVDMLTDQIAAGHLVTDAPCSDPANTFSYYSSFTFEGASYCFLDEAMWTMPDNFFITMMALNDIEDPAAVIEWDTLFNEWIEVLYDHDTGGENGLTELIDIITALIADLEDCELVNCAEVICPDCEAIADDLATALDYLAVLELAADLIDTELTDIETEIDSVLDQLQQWEDLKAEFEAMVEDAGGMHGADCDNFEVQSGQAWGVAHNFGDVQWCFTSEAQIEQMIQNLDEYWQTNSSLHLPSETELNQQLDDLMNSYFDKLAAYDAALTAIEDQNALIDEIIIALDECLTELAALQAQGECLDQDLAAMETALTDATAEVDAGYEPTPPAEPAPEELPGDIGGHWAEENITNLFNAGVVSGDGDTGDFRPNDNLNRAEAAKILVLANEDFVTDVFFDIFFDVTEDDWFWTFVNTASDYGYFEGYPDGSFGPGNSILRAEAIAVVMRALEFNIPEYTEYSFPDLTGDEWFANYAEKAYLCGIVSGRDGNFEGGETITRAEMSKIIDISLLGNLLEADCTV